MSNKKKLGLGKTSNPVAKFGKRFNKSVVMTDRKKEEKKNPKSYYGDSDEHIRIR